jgi:hypothetical protein
MSAGFLFNKVLLLENFNILFLFRNVIIIVLKVRLLP